MGWEIRFEGSLVWMGRVGGSLRLATRIFKLVRIVGWVLALAMLAIFMKCTFASIFILILHSVIFAFMQMTYLVMDALIINALFVLYKALRLYFPNITHKLVGYDEN